MDLHLSAAEAELLGHLIEERIHQLEHEVSHTDSREFRVLLRNRRELLEGILDRLAHDTAEV